MASVSPRISSILGLVGPARMRIVTGVKKILQMCVIHACTERNLMDLAFLRVKFQSIAKKLKIIRRTAFNARKMSLKASIKILSRNILYIWTSPMQNAKNAHRNVHLAAPLKFVTTAKWNIIP